MIDSLRIPGHFPKNYLLIPDCELVRLIIKCGYSITGSKWMDSYGTSKTSWVHQILCVENDKNQGGQRGKSKYIGKEIRANLFYIVTLALVWVAPDFAQSLKCLKVASFAPNHVHWLCFEKGVI